MDGCHGQTAHEVDMANQSIDLGNTNNTITPTPADDNYVITGGDGNNTVTLGSGVDQFTLGNGSNTLTVGNGPDLFTLGAGNNTVTTGNGNSQLTVSNGNNTITVGTGSNTVSLGAGLSTVHTAAGNNVVSVSTGAIDADIIMGALTSSDGSTNQLVLTTTGTMSPVNVSGFQSYRLGNGGANSLTLANGNFARLPGGLITVIGGDSGNTVNAASLSAAFSVTIDAGAGTDVFTGGAGNDTFVFTPSNVSGDAVDGGTGNNTIELAAGGTGILNGLGTSIVHIGQVVLDANATWTIGISNPVAFTGTIFGFVAGNTLNLTNVAFDSNGSAKLGTNNQLLITENSTAYTIQLDPAQNFTGDFFHLADAGAGSQVTVNTMPCFCSGTRILTDHGEVAVEDLAIGDRVRTMHGVLRPIQWIGFRRVECRRHSDPRLVWPVRISAGAFGPSLPVRDLVLSPDHSVYMNDVLIPIKHLINGRSVMQIHADQATYYHLELSQHDVVFAEGLPAESYLDVGDRANFANGDVFIRLFPDLSDHPPGTAMAWEGLGCAPLMITGPKVEVVRRLLEARARTQAAGRRLNREVAQRKSLQ
jgi:hypothetical protein